MRGSPWRQSRQRCPHETVWPTSKAEIKRLKFEKFRRGEVINVKYWGTVHDPNNDIRLTERTVTRSQRFFLGGKDLAILLSLNSLHHKPLGENCNP